MQFIFVEDNLPPIANAGKNTQKELSELASGHSVFLNATLSTDDGNITKYKWSQIGLDFFPKIDKSIRKNYFKNFNVMIKIFSGPKNTTIANADQQVATASNLDVIGEYQYLLTVTDNGNLFICTGILIRFLKIFENHTDFYLIIFVTKIPSTNVCQCNSDIFNCARN